MIKLIRILILPVVLILIAPNSWAGCFGLTSLFGGKKKSYADIHRALSDLQSALEKIRELGSRKWKPMDTHLLVDMVAPSNKVPLSDIKEMKEDFSLLQTSLSTVATSFDVLSSAMDEPAERLVQSRGLEIMYLIITRSIYSNSFVHSMRLIERFRNSPQWVNGHNAEISATLKAVDPRALDADLKIILKRLQKMNTSLPEVLVDLVEDLRSSKSPGRLETSATLVKPPAGVPFDMSLEDYSRWAQRWDGFLSSWQANREKANSVKVPPLSLPAFGAGLVSSTPTPAVAVNGQKPLIDEALAKDLGVAPRDQNGDGSKPSRNGLVAKSDRSRQMAIDMMPAKQRGEYMARQAQDQKLKAARQSGGAAAKPAE